MTQANYNCGSRAYLARARMQLDQNATEALFYAALELRFGIEARLHEYLEVQHHVSKKRREGWKIAELGKNLKRAFDDGDKVVEIVINDQESGESVACYYTPVTASLKKNGQQLGNYLHALKEHKPPGHKWWDDFRSLLEAACQELKVATTGRLLGPPLLSPDNRTQLCYELGYDDTADTLVKKFGGVGKLMQMSVKYLDSLPEVKG